MYNYNLLLLVLSLLAAMTLCSAEAAVGCVDDDMIRKPGETWINNQTKKCICGENYKIHCKKSTGISGADVVVNAGCVYEDISRKPGETWMKNQNEKCMCIGNSRIYCKRMVYGCVSGGEVRRAGESWDEGIEHCTCTTSLITKCTINKCLHKGTYYIEGEHFKYKDQHCQCENKMVNCKQDSSVGCVDREIFREGDNICICISGKPSCHHINTIDNDQPLTTDFDGTGRIGHDTEETGELIDLAVVGITTITTLPTTAVSSTAPPTLPTTLPSLVSTNDASSTAPSTLPTSVPSPVPTNVSSTVPITVPSTIPLTLGSTVSTTMAPEATSSPPSSTAASTLKSECTFNRITYKEGEDFVLEHLLCTCHQGIITCHSDREVSSSSRQKALSYFPASSSKSSAASSSISSAASHIITHGSSGAPTSIPTEATKQLTDATPTQMLHETCYFNLETYSEGEMFTLGNVQCSCKQAQISCEPVTCQFNSENYEDGARFSIGNLDCLCKDRHITCDLKNRCTYGGVTYHGGAKWKDGAKDCSCNRRVVMCLQQKAACTWNATDYSDGDEFQVVGMQCTCVAGVITCQQIEQKIEVSTESTALTLLATTAPPPPPLDGMCTFNGVIYKEGVKWKHSSKYCSCLRGVVTCTSHTPCSPSPCGGGAVCREYAGIATCTCLTAYRGNPFTACTPNTATTAPCVIPSCFSTICELITHPGDNCPVCEPKLFIKNMDKHLRKRILGTNICQSTQSQPDAA